VWEAFLLPAAVVASALILAGEISSFGSKSTIARGAHKAGRGIESMGCAVPRASGEASWMSSKSDAGVIGDGPSASGADEQRVSSAARKS
jgi:archaellin